MRGAGRQLSSRHRAQRRGRLAEALCRWHLRLRGWRIVAVDWRCPSGEIDILARRGRVLAVIEVKSRGDFASAAGAVLPRQRRRIARAASAFLMTRPDLAELALRFDVMLVTPLRPPRHMADAWRDE
ncbi:MAG TPA: YraN family protein [Stellaceae bacterium]|jgi:putative endonuclease|nr:YraN family protein [Stellaceae bacterium]